MKSDIITIDNMGKGFSEAVAQAQKVAAYREMSGDASLELQLITEEMLSMARSIAGDVNASFWLEAEGMVFSLHLTAETVMDSEKRNALISASSSRKNDAVKGFLSDLRDRFEQAMVSEPSHAPNDLPYMLLSDINNNLEDPEWDGYEESVLKKLADEIRIGIRGNVVDMTVTKSYTK